MNKYTITLEIISNMPPDWVVPCVEEQLENNESVKYFDYKIEEVTE